MNKNEIDEIINKQLILATSVFDKTKDFDEEQRLKIYEEINKDIRTQLINQQKQQNDKPTQKQLEFALNLGIQSPEKYSKQELSEKIKEAKNRK